MTSAINAHHLTSQQALSLLHRVCGLNVVRLQRKCRLEIHDRALDDRTAQSSIETRIASASVTTQGLMHDATLPHVTRALAPSCHRAGTGASTATHALHELARE